MDGSGGTDKRGAREKDQHDGKDGKEKAKGGGGQKSTTSKLRERWLMTRKTWRYMTDAGKKLFPEGVNPHQTVDVPKIQEHFQKTCCKSKEFILWPHHGSSAQDIPPYQCPYRQAREQGTQSSSVPTTSSSVPIPKDRRRPGNIQPQADPTFSEDENSGPSSFPSSPTQVSFSHSGFPSSFRDRRISSSDLAWVLPPEIYAQLVRCYGTSTLQNVASRLLEEQLTEEDEYEYEEDEGVELLEIDGKRMRSIGAQTDSHLDMCVQTDHDDSAEDMVKVGAETRAETEAAFALSQAQKREAEGTEQPKGIDKQEHTSQRAQHKSKTFPQQEQSQQPFQKETPVLKKFWGRRDSKVTGEQTQQSIAAAEKSRGLASEKDREAPPPKGGVAAKLASLEAASTHGAIPKVAQKAPTPQPTHKPTPVQQIEKSPPKQPEKKTLKNVFKLGLKCDTEATEISKKNLEKQNADRFKTVNYDKTLRNIKTKWTKEDDELLLRMLAQQEMKEPPKELPKKKKKSRAIQVGEALPQFILSALRVSSPVEIFYATRRRIRRRSSKAESTDMSGSEGSVSLAPSMPTSPRYSITVADESGTRNLLLSESEAIRLTQMGATLYNKRTSLDASLDSADGDREGPLMGGIPREYPIGMGNMTNIPGFQRSLSAHQMPSMAGFLPHMSYGASSRISGRYSNPQSMAAAAAAARGHRASILQCLLPAVMQRARAGAPSGGHSSRLVAKRIWRTRSKSQSRASAATTSTWTPMGGNLWLSVTGIVVTLESASLLQLSEIERLTLQRLALAKLAALNLGCVINLPKDSSSVSSSKKRRPYLLKRKALTTGFFDSKKDDSKDTITGNSTGGQVFGLSLSKCLDNERIRQQQAAELSAAAAATVAATVAASAGLGLERGPGGGTEDVEGGCLSRKSSRTGSHTSFCSLAEGAKQSSTGSLESLNLDRKRPSLASGDLLTSSAGPCTSDLLQIDPPLSQVPSLVTACCNHLLQYGLNTLGIFRVSSSKKRVRQLREEFDRGGEVLLTEEQCPHDVATLLKEFFRDLPEPLLTRDLYEPFLCTQKIRNRKLKLEATQHLLQLLPAPNRDTLYALLSFLTTVAEHAADTAAETGEVIPGNMMDSSNLATMFAPNILHMHRSGADNVSPAALAAMADERADCTSVVRSMIDHNKELFEVGAELLDETYHHLMDSHAEALDVMLRRRAPPHDDLEVDLESGSSVFEGSECSSSLPRSPTEHQDFDRLRGGDDPGEGGNKGRRREDQVHESITCTAQDILKARRKCEEECKAISGPDNPAEERGWFRRRDKSSSRELERGSEEKSSERSRWFRRRDKTSPRGSVDHGIRRRGSDKKHEKALRKEEKLLLSKRQNSIDRNRESGSESADSREHRQRSSSDQTVVHERLRVPEPTVRRLSSPEIDTCGVITASLKIPVPLQQQGPQSVFKREPDIPFIEDAVLTEEARTRRREGSVATSRQRTGSSDSYLGQPITGTMSFQPLCKKDGDKQSHDSVLSSSSADAFTLSPSPRNTPLSDLIFASETSSQVSGIMSPPLMISPDSGTPGLSPPSSPPPLFPRRTRRNDQKQLATSRIIPLSHSATHTFGTKSAIVSAISIKDTRESTGSKLTSTIPISRSRTAEVPYSTTSPIQALDRTPTSRDTIVHTQAVIRSSTGTKISVSGDTVSGNSYNLKRYTRRRHTRERDGTIDAQQHNKQQPQTTEAVASPQLWKRWEIIASDPAEPETFV